MSAIDYELSRVRGVVFDVDGVLSSATVPLDGDGVPVRCANLKDGYAIKLAVSRGLNVAILSGADTAAVRRRYESLGVKDIFTGSFSKAEVLDRWMRRHGLTPDEVAYAGDDVPDYEAMQMVGLRVAPADACRDILAIANYISPCSGGCGVARDLLEQLLRARNLWSVKANSFG